MIYSRHMEERMVQRGFDARMIDFILQKGEHDREHARFVLTKRSRAQLKKEIGTQQKNLHTLTHQLAEAKRRMKSLQHHQTRNIE